MTNTVALWLAALLILSVAGDLVLQDGAWLVFLGKKFLALTDWVAFWR
ncbi:hypothetical protein [Poseidonocella sedimentorum]|uniref:Uncharacterized protein n=1 Tax=Poseidonocella sedimentorum TaxID=871652 RepID=A0A1I6DEX7_9RHOB|nr:hypothetical protein [Poseidonocella sedimentorum]SFR04009.1 hypothetical protein SAMN04515673_103101 [Poseidonocella sedimentorum]